MKNDVPSSVAVLSRSAGRRLISDHGKSEPSACSRWSRKENFRPDKFVLSLLFLVLGFMLISGFGFQKFAYQNDQYPKVAPNVKESGVKGFSTANNDADPPVKIVIPALSVDLEVRQARLISGYWEVFDDAAGWGEGSGVPGKPGNQVIFAHARQGLFLPLKGIEKGDLVYVFTDSDWYAYQVIQMKEVYPNETSEILPTEEEILTLYTCSGFADSKRLIVSAEPLN